ncbi:MAG: sce7726 family protein [Clostridiales Family XIII bacterium]|nr:sce7726 family protein [Clostridiales Family XIII bacterium]
MADNSRAINRVFTRGVIGELLQNGSNEVFDYVVHRYVNDPESKTHGELFSKIYAHLGKEKRNEYYYMNTLLNKLLVGIHSVNTTTALSQLRIGQHIADFAMINGESKVYEIKSELDNFDRLHDQLSDYFKAFSKVSVLASIHGFERVERVLSVFGDMGKAVGIYVLSDRDTIFSKTYSREPKQYDEELDHACIFKLLRKREYENAVRSYFGEIPQASPVFHFRACFECFEQIPVLEAQKLAFTELKKRNMITSSTFSRIQPELKSVIYFSNLTKRLNDVEQMLALQYRR